MESIGTEFAKKQSVHEVCARQKNEDAPFMMELVGVLGDREGELLPGQFQPVAISASQSWRPVTET